MDGAAAMRAGRASPQETLDEYWLFGYGSLIWKPPPHFDQRIPGWVTGYVRRFWQESPDHRGTPSAPGRVVTLIESSVWRQLGGGLGESSTRATLADGKVWGVAYRIPPEHIATVKEYLDVREVAGYTTHRVPFHQATGGILLGVHVYIGTPDNPQFVGPQDPQVLAKHIWRSKGESGPNSEYLWMLEQALDKLGPESGDDHVTDLCCRVREIGKAHQPEHDCDVIF